MCRNLIAYATARFRPRDCYTIDTSSGQIEFELTRLAFGRACHGIRKWRTSRLAEVEIGDDPQQSLQSDSLISAERLREMGLRLDPA
jgi:hypothetical protein